MSIISWFYQIKHKIYCAYMKHKYSDWEDNDRNCGDLKFIWGIKSYDCLTSAPANLYTMNDIDIIYSRKTGLYTLGIETAYTFENSKQCEAEYLNSLLQMFTQFMIDNNYKIDEPYMFWMGQPGINYFAESIPSLYTQFRIFVEGYKAVYGGEDNA